MTFDEAFRLYPECVEFEKTGVTGNTELRHKTKEIYEYDYNHLITFTCYRVYRILAAKYWSTLQ